MDKHKNKKKLKEFFNRSKRAEFTQRLFKEFPELFRCKNDRRKSLMCFGVECEKGWYDIIYSLTKGIYEICKKHGKFIEVQQIKEKFGGLRYYTSAIPKEFAEEVLSMIREAEDESFKICEKCGKPGKIRTKGWYRTLCDKCQKDIETKRTYKNQ